MSALNFIPPTPVAASKKTGNGGWNVEDTDSSPAHPLSSPHPAQSEIFQLVMDHLPVFVSGTRLPAKSKTGQFASSEVPAPKMDEAGKTGTDAANVNRWRGQVGLPPASPDELKISAESVEADRKSVV